MYYVIVKAFAIGPFDTRQAAYKWAVEYGLDQPQYAVKSDTVMQREYQHLTIKRP